MCQSISRFGPSMKPSTDTDIITTIFLIAVPSEVVRIRGPLIFWASRALGRGRDFPKVAVGVAEVPEVPPLGGCCLLHDAATGGHGLAHDLVDGFARGDDEMERCTPEAGTLGGDAGVLGCCLPLVEGQRRRPVTQIEGYEIRMILFDRAAEAFPIELLRTRQVL